MKRLSPSRLRTFMKRVEVDEQTGCWDWQGVLNHGYPMLAFQRAHRHAYTHWKGSIPTGYHVDHMCRNIRCVNPDHLDAVTNTENQRRKWLARNDSHSYNREIFPGSS